MLPFQFLDIAEGLMHIDPVRTYPQRGAALVAKLADAKGFRLEPSDGSPSITSDPPPADGATSVSLPLRAGKQTLGTLHLLLSHDASRLGAAELRTARWGARILARGMLYANRLAGEGRRRSAEDVVATLARAPLTPRERDVVQLLISGASTRDIAQRTSLTVATVNTYLKRIFSKLGVHSRVELVARMAGTDGVNGDDDDDGGNGSSDVHAG